MNIQSIKTFAKENQLLAVLIGLAIIIFLSLAQNAIFAQPEVDEVPKISQVNLISAKDYTNVETSIKTVGTVDTLGTVDITAELSGEITDIPVKLGQKVYTGQPLMYINADDLAAQLKSAEAGLEIEKLSLDRLNNGITPESKQSLEQRLSSAKEIYAQYQKQFDLLKNSVGNEDANSTVSIVNNLKTYLDSIKSTLALIGKLQGDYYSDEGRVFANKEQAIRLLYGKCGGNLVETRPGRVAYDVVSYTKISTVTDVHISE
jgi:multidrug efflux pump subunit AcrA (membrane-fusion protein)